MQAELGLEDAADKPVEYTASEWLGRSYKQAEAWKAKARAVFLEVCGDSQAARNRLAAQIREYFLTGGAKTEKLEVWRQGVDKPVVITAVPPKITASNASYHDFERYADYLLQCCAVADVIADENLARDAEYQQLAKSYAVRANVYIAFKYLQQNSSATDEQLLEAIVADKDFESEKPALAHVKEARKAAKAGQKMTRPREPQRAQLARFESKYYPMPEPTAEDSDAKVQAVVDAWKDCEERIGFLAWFMRESTELTKEKFRRALSRNQLAPPRDRKPSQKYALALCESWEPCSPDERKVAVMRILEETELDAEERTCFTAYLLPTT